MAIGVAVDILGCTGSLEERAATLNRIILVALELKDSMGDLYAFSSLMKALDMPQVALTLCTDKEVWMCCLTVRNMLKAFRVCMFAHRSPDWITHGQPCEGITHRRQYCMKSLSNLSIKACMKEVVRFFKCLLCYCALPFFPYNVTIPF